MGAEQSNTQIGDIVALANVALTSKEGYLALLADSSGTPKAALPTANTDICQFVIFEGSAAGQRTTLRPLESGRNVRVVLKGTCNPGDRLCLADVSVPADAGKVRALPSASATYLCFLKAEEVGVDGQLLKCRPYGLQSVTVE